ncbi:MAG: Rrf2 family transcriptional regulator [Candidatus Omnitrophota bacterium]|nr:Rrf2 family transcriptional regulator [Candidatus Omnitrophota bacterium]MDZ4242666.1 Rrf2 family transcriptional regulator [Candidatus Omnitrophota bacterium]
MLSKTSLQVIKALAELARLPDDKWEGAASIAKKIRAPQNYLGKVLQGLCNEGLVESQKGFGGGFRLARPPQKISLYDIMEPIEGVSRWDGCFMGKKQCSDNAPCAVHSRWSSVRESYLAFLKATTLEDLAK